ncbi:MAG: MMPL family transporter [Planctomycetota bacterium]|nr:MMPL family transporter [Planctomycetota bacterium]MDA1212739.1 MMPL family transporter [Planctomycetota bacterium]
MGANHDQPMLSSGLRTLTRGASRYPRITLFCLFLSVCAAVAFTVTNLEFKTRRSDLIDPRAKFHQRWLNYSRQFGDTSDLIIVVEADKPSDIRDVIDELGRRMEKNKDLFQNVWYRLNTDRVMHKGLQFLTPEQLDDVHKQLTVYRRVIQGEWELVRLPRLLPLLTWQLEQKQSTAALQSSTHWDHVQLLGHSLEAFRKDRENFIPPWPMVRSIPKETFDLTLKTDYLMNEQQTMGYMKATPVVAQASFNGAEQSIDRLRTWMDELSETFPHVTIGLTGIPVLESDEMRRSQFDSMITTAISAVGVLVLLVVGFRGKKHPFILMVTLAISLAWTFAFATLAIGHLNILTISFTAILVGLGIDFSIHFLSRYLQLRHEGEALRPAIVETSGNVGLGIVTSALTTGLAFFCATLTPFLGVAELGIIAGGGIILCVIATFITMPALLSWADRSTEETILPAPLPWVFLRKITATYPRLTLFAACCVVGAAGSQMVEYEEGKFSSRVHYDYNLLNLQAKDVDSVKVLERMSEQSLFKVLFAVSLADSAADAREMARKYQALPTVDHVETLATRLPPAPLSTTRPYIQQIAQELVRLPNAPPTFPPPDPAQFGISTEKLWKALRKIRTEEGSEISATFDEFLDHFERMSLNEQVQFLAEYEARMIGSLWRQLQMLRTGTNDTPLSLDDYPREIRNRFISKDGKWLVQVYPKGKIWDFEPLHQFVTDIRSVDPEATGTPLQNYEAGQQIRESYENAAYFALIVIFMVLLWDSMDPVHSWGAMIPPALVLAATVMILNQRGITLPTWMVAGAYVGMVATISLIWDWRSVRDTCLIMLPPVAGGVMMFGVLGLLQVNLNAANLIVLPLILGIGVDNGVHVVHEFRRQLPNRFMLSPSTTNAILLTSMTTILGFGSMMLAAHQGLFSLGLVLTVGVACSLFVSLFPLPAILCLASQPRGATAEADKSAEDETRAETKTLRAEADASCKRVRRAA